MGDRVSVIEAIDGPLHTSSSFRRPLAFLVPRRERGSGGFLSNDARTRSEFGFLRRRLTGPG